MKGLFKTAMATRKLSTQLTLVFLVISTGNSLLAQQAPIPGTGSGGAFGPIVIPSLKALPNSTPSKPRAELNDNRPRINAAGFTPAPTSVVIRSRDVRVDLPVGQAGSTTSTTMRRGGTSAVATAETSTLAGFSGLSEVDANGASEGNFVLTWDDLELSIYGNNGGLIKRTGFESFWCSSSPQLPICSAGGFNVDPRIKYDPGARRWLISSLWAFGNNTIAADVIAVSQSSDPTQGWNVYQFPACGAFDTWDGGDQPHTGFNDQWIVIATACSASSSGQNGAGLAVFDKANLYAGGSLTLNQNWFEFVDPLSGGQYVGIGGGCCNRDNPVPTYASTPNHAEYLVSSTVISGNAAFVYSRVQGAADSPSFVSQYQTTITSFPANGNIGVNAPGCPNCLTSLANTWVHSAGVYQFANGAPFILSTAVWGDPGKTDSTQVVSTATNASTGASTSVQLASSTPGFGALGAQIAMPLVSPHGNDLAVIVYDYSDSNFFPGIKSVEWNLDNNTLSNGTVIQEGALTPNNGDQNRWLDFSDMLSPIPGTTEMFAAGHVAGPSSNDPQRQTFFTLIVP